MFKCVVVLVHIMKAYVEWVYLHIFLAVVCGGDEWSASHDSHSTLQGRAPAPLNCRQGGPPDLVWILWRREESLGSAGC
jgi:hypothetical protein